MTRIKVSMLLTEGAAMEGRKFQATLRTALILEHHTEMAAATCTLASSVALDDDGIDADFRGLVLTFSDATWIFFVSGNSEGVRSTLYGGDIYLASGCAQSP